MPFIHLSTPHDHRKPSHIFTDWHLNDKNDVGLTFILFAGALSKPLIGSLVNLLSAQGPPIELQAILN